VSSAKDEALARRRAAISGAKLRDSPQAPRGGKGLTFPGVVGIVAMHPHGGGPTTAKGECLERLAPAKRQARTRAESPTVQEKFLLFRVGEEIYGMGLRGLREVLLPDGMMLLPTPSYQVCVALEHRGRRIPVIRMRALFEGSPAGVPPTARVLLTQGQARPIGLLVDEVLEMVEVDPGRIGAVPALATLLDPSCFRGLFTRQERIILLVNEDGLGGLDEVVQFYATGS
jgi:purine-binding chemotaxis protein CheW